MDAAGRSVTAKHDGRPAATSGHGSSEQSPTHDARSTESDCGTTNHA